MFIPIVFILLGDNNLGQNVCKYTKFTWWTSTPGGLIDFRNISDQ